MNKAFEKILERLEEYKYKHRGSDGHYITITNDLKEIVQEVAEEYNNGWIPVSERLPNQYGEITDVLITCESTADGVFVQSAEFYITAYGEPTFDGLYNYERVLAWRLLPEPYEECENND